MFKVFSKHFSKPLCKNAAQASLTNVILLKGVWISRLKVQNEICWSYYFDNLKAIRGGGSSNVYVTVFINEIL